MQSKIRRFFRAIVSPAISISVCSLLFGIGEQSLWWGIATIASLYLLYDIVQGDES